MRQGKLLHRFYRTIRVSALLSGLILSACNGAVQLCGEYACVYYQNDYQGDCQANSFSPSNCTNQTRQCEAAGSIRDRAPRIISELREVRRSCGNFLITNSTTQNNTRFEWDDSLAQMSAIHARDMANNRFEAFIGSDGLSTQNRARLAGIESGLLTESIDAGPQTAAEVVNEWLDIETDCRQLLNSQTTRIGMACAVSDAADSGPYWSLVLAGPEP